MSEIFQSKAPSDSLNKEVNVHGKRIGKKSWADKTSRILINISGRKVIYWIALLTEYFILFSFKMIQHFICDDLKTIE